MVILRIVTGVLLTAHGLVHLLYLAPDVPAFTLDRSWLLPDQVRRPVALGLMALTVVSFVLLALAVWGAPGLSAIWPALTVAAAVVSALLIVALWDKQLVLGLVIDAALVAVAITSPPWATELVGGQG